METTTRPASPSPGGFKAVVRNLFGGSGVPPEHSNSVPLTETSPLPPVPNPYLSVDPQYQLQNTDDEYIVLTEATQLKSPHLATYYIGGGYLTGGVCGALNGLRLGMKETRDMAWSKPRNVLILNMVRKQGASWAATLGTVALFYSVFDVAIEKARGAEHDTNKVAAGTLAGMLFKSTGGLRGVARGGLAGLAMSGAYTLYNNMGTPRQVPATPNILNMNVEQNLMT